MNTPRPRASVIIPAHDEGRVIARALARLHTERYDVQIIVSANGCTDNTAQIARDTPGVTVIESSTPSKRAALNAADEIATAHPRIYLDADTTLEPGCLDALIDACRTERAILAVAPATFDTRAASPAVRAFYRIFELLPYVRSGYSSGVFAFSQTGRARFGPFPELDGDDLFVQRLFAPAETIVVDRACIVTTPRDLRRLVRIRSRVARGNAGLSAYAPEDRRFASSAGSTLSALGALLRRRPALIPSAIVYLGVTLTARVRARRDRGWERDDSSR